MRKILGADSSIKTIKEVELIRQYYFQKAKNNPSFAKRLEAFGIWHGCLWNETPEHNCYIDGVIENGI